MYGILHGECETAFFECVRFVLFEEVTHLSVFLCFIKPVLFSFPAVNRPLHAATLEGLKRVPASRFQSIAVEQFADSDVSEEGLVGLGSIFQDRVEFVQQYVLAHPDASLKEIAFETIGAWKRDYPRYEEESDSAEWIEETLAWAAGGQRRRFLCC